MGDARGLLRIVHIICGWTDQLEKSGGAARRKKPEERERVKRLKRSRRNESYQAE